MSNERSELGEAAPGPDATGMPVAASETPVAESAPAAAPAPAEAPAAVPEQPVAAVAAPLVESVEAAPQETAEPAARAKPAADSTEPPGDLAAPAEPAAETVPPQAEPAVEAAAETTEPPSAPAAPAEPPVEMVSTQVQPAAEAAADTGSTEPSSEQASAPEAEVSADTEPAPPAQASAGAVSPQVSEGAQAGAPPAPAQTEAEAAPAKAKRGKGEAKPAAEAEEAPLTPQAAFKIVLPAFEGPLDLLLHLIREHKVDIFDIPISLITEKYLQTLKVMKDLNLDIAGEFILMAATLTHIKSRMLLPNPEEQPGAEDELTDPREELVKRLLEYQKYKAAGEELGRADLLDREVFTRRARMDQIPLSEGEIGLVEVSVFKLVEALDATLKNAKIHVPHQVIVDRISLGEAIAGLVERLKIEPRTSFFHVLGEGADRQKIVVTFLALLEMTKLGLIRVYQEEDKGDILISAKDPDSLAPAEIKDDYK